jgi:hypothetical protein
MSEQKPDLNVYGHNLPEDRGHAKPGIREKSIVDALEHTRQDSATPMGGMGRENVPKDGVTPGNWYRDDNYEAHGETDVTDGDHREAPKPPLHAPLSDEEPS